MPAKDPTGYMRDYRAARRQSIEARPCQHCEKPFTPQRSDARFCSNACRSAHRNARIDITWLRLVFLKNGRGCAEPGCGAEHARWVQRHHHVRTGQTEESYWCDEHADRPPVRKAVVRTGQPSVAVANALEFGRSRRR